MKMLVLLSSKNYLRDYNSEDLETFVSEGDAVFVFESEEHAQEYTEAFGIEYEAV